MLLGAVLAGYPLAEAGDAAPGVAALAAFSLVLLALSLMRMRLIGFVLVGLAAEFVARELVGHVPAGIAVGYGTGLLLLGELVAWAEALRPQALVERSVAGRRTAHLCALALLAAIASGLTLTGSGISPPNTFAAGVAGAAAVATLLAVVGWLGRQAS